MTDIERYQLEAWVGLMVWMLASVWLTVQLMRASMTRRPGSLPFANGVSMLGIGNIAEASIYLWLLYHPRTWLGMWGIDLIFGFLIFRGIGFLLIGLWVRRRRIE